MEIEAKAFNLLELTISEEEIVRPYKILEIREICIIRKEEELEFEQDLTVEIVTIKWWDPTNASGDSIWYEEETPINRSRKENGETSKSEKEGRELDEELWAREEVLMRPGRHFKPFELEVEHLGTEIDKGKGVIIPKEEEEDHVLKRQKKMQATITVWG